MLEAFVAVDGVLLKYHRSPIDRRVVLRLVSTVPHISLLRDRRRRNAQDVAAEEILVVDLIRIASASLPILAVKETLGRRTQDDIILRRKGVSEHTTLKERTQKWVQDGHPGTSRVVRGAMVIGSWSACRWKGAMVKEDGEGT
jgi:hypothetical protein